MEPPRPRPTVVFIVHTGPVEVWLVDQVEFVKAAAERLRQGDASMANCLTINQNVARQLVARVTAAPRGHRGRSRRR